MSNLKTKILITGSEGFIGKNLKKELELIKDYELTFFNRDSDINKLEELIFKSNFIIHLAGVNRPKEKELFKNTNVVLTKNICNFIEKKYIKKGIHTPIIFTSSTQVNQVNEYGISKLDAELELKKLYKKTSNPITIYRLPGIFGKWCRPNYNSVVATFCHNIANNIEISINDENKNLEILYIDDLIQEIINNLRNFLNNFHYQKLKPYQINLKDLANLIKEFRDSRKTKIIPNVGDGLIRRLYATYLSYINSDNFSYSLIENKDKRGSFVEILKTKSSGQFSFFTAKPGVVRGCHYHNTKNEKFLVIKGEARFRFRNILTNECKEIFVNEKEPTVIDSCPGWSHDIKNIGENTLYVMLWANEIFDLDNPDTIFSPTF